MTTGKTTTEETTKQYPTVPNAEGWFFETEAEEENGISTQIDDNDFSSKKFTTKKGQVVVVKEVTAEQIMKAKQIAGIKAKKIPDPTDGDRLQFAMIELTTTIDDKPVFANEAPKMSSKILGKILELVSELNF